MKKYVRMRKLIIVFTSVFTIFSGLLFYIFPTAQADVEEKDSYENTLKSISFLYGSSYAETDEMIRDEAHANNLSKFSVAQEILTQAREHVTEEDGDIAVRSSSKLADKKLYSAKRGDISYDPKGAKVAVHRFGHVGIYASVTSIVEAPGKGKSRNIGITNRDLTVHSGTEIMEVRTT
ncbi:MAG: hypothetical protein J6M18_02470 [Actinomycetaceae bacterium]|nr:hypothetical protein [Actinomycetaceae bacterium]